MKRNLIFTILLLIFISQPANSLASGFPEVSGGPGKILPDSPIYAFDRIYQKGKLFLAFTPQKRAEIRNAIMGERMAEIRLMYEKGDKTAMGLALLELNEEGRKIEYDLKQAKLVGIDVSGTAKNVTDSLRYYRKILAQASFEANEVVASLLESSSYSLLSSKIVIEDFLSPRELADAMQNDLDDEGETAVLGVQKKAEKLERKIEALEKKADRQAALEQKKTLTNGKEEKAILEKRKQLLEQRKKLMLERKKKLTETRDALKRAREAAKGFVELEKQGKTLPVEPLE